MSNTIENVDEAIVEAPIEGEGTAEAVVSKPKKEKRRKKNHTDTQIDPSIPTSIDDFLSEFYANAATHPPDKGYDQHYNKDGFVHGTPAARLPDTGIARMVAVLIDTLADRATSDDAQKAAKANAMYDLIEGWIKDQRNQKRADKNALILAKAREIEAQNSAQ